MKQNLKVIAWVEVVLGVLAIIGWAGDTSDGYALIGGLMFLVFGFVALKYIGENETKQ